MSNDKLIYSENNDDNYIDNKIIKFWNEDVWKINYLNIINKNIKDIITQINYQSKIKTKFTINSNFDFEIVEHSDSYKENIKKKINKIKKDNIHYLKTHADCIFEYQEFIFTNLKNKNYKIDDNSKECINLTNNLNENLLNTDINDYEKILLKDVDIFINLIDKNENINEILNKLKINLKNNILEIFNFYLNNKNNENILLLDTENIIKSLKIQNIIKKYISEDEFNNYFNTWIYGFHENNELLSDYSSKIKYIEPYTSLSLDINSKYQLINLLINNYLQKYKIIVIITTKLNEKLNNDNNNNNLYIPIIYNKIDIREQDDHLLLFLYFHFQKLGLSVNLISSDKFKWFTDKLDKIYNFIYEYNFDENKINILIDKSHTNDIYITNFNKFIFPFNNFPILDEKFLFIINLDDINKELIKDNNFIENINLELYIKILLNIYIQKSNNKIVYFEQIINNLILFSKYLINNFEIIFKLFNKYTKKEIEKINNYNFKNDDINKIKKNINDYKYFVNIYIIIKCIIISYNLKELILKNVRIFTNLIHIYDELNNNIYKIRKLSNNKNDFDKMLNELNSLFIYIKKQGFFKKNF